MEEDIKILEEFKTKGYSMLFMKYGDRITTNLKLEKALENLIKGYREVEREKEMHKNNSNKLYKDYNKLTDEFDLLNKENNRNKETIKRYRKYLNKKDKRFKEALENEYQERETDYIQKSKIKEIVDECIPKGKNIITGKEEYKPNTNANSYLTQRILELMEDK